MKYDYEQLEALMLQKNFKALSPQEQKVVKTFMSEQEYQLQRNILLESKQIFAQKPSLSAPNLGKLQARLKAQHAISWSSYFMHPIPAYQAVLSTIIVGCLLWWLRPTAIQTQYQTQIQQEIVYIPQIDTFVQEKLIIKEKIVYRNKTIQLPAAPDTVWVPLIDKQQFYKEKDKTQIFAKSKPKGKSMKEMGRLMDFVVGAD